MRFRSQRFLTRGVASSIPLPLQLTMWGMIEQIPTPDYLQVFTLTGKDGEQSILHEQEDGSFILAIRCGRGTYIRTLCNDIGDAMGCKAHMGMLLRTQTGMFTLDDAHTVEEIDAAEDLSPMLVEMDLSLIHI